MILTTSKEFDDMARSKAYRKYLLTINSPVEHNMTHDVIKTTLGKFAGLEYWCMCDEIGGKSATYHTHLYLAAKNAIQFHTIKQRFYCANIQAAKGSHQQNRDYILKEGKWLTNEKHNTSIPNTFEESGPLPPEFAKRQSQSEEILAMLDAGADNEEIIRAFPSWIKNIKNLDAMRQTLLEKSQQENWRDLKVHYLFGETGVGKTRSVLEEHGYKNVFRVTNYTHPFDGYKGQPVILFDEFRSDLPIKDMLKYLDGYPLMLPCRYCDKAACYTQVYIVSNIPLDAQYKSIQAEEPSTWKAFLRRINTVKQMLPPTSPLPGWIYEEGNDV